MSDSSLKCILCTLAFILALELLGVRTDASSGEGPILHDRLDPLDKKVGVSHFLSAPESRVHSPVLKLHLQDHGVMPRRKRNVLFPSGVRLCGQENVQQAITNHLNYFQLRVCQETVWEAFKIFWDRLPNQEDYQAWMSQCLDGKVTALEIGSHFSKSKEHQALVEGRVSRMELKSEPTNTSHQMCSPPTPAADEEVQGEVISEVTVEKPEATEAEFSAEPTNDIQMEVLAPPTLVQRDQVVEMSILLKGEPYSEALRDPASLQYQTLNQQFTDKIHDALGGLPGFKSVAVQEFRLQEDSQGSDGVVVVYTVTVDVEDEGVSHEQLYYLNLQSNRVEMSYSEVEERPTLVYTLTDFRSYITEALHKDDIISDTNLALDTESPQLTTESSLIESSEPIAETPEDDSHDGVEDILASESPPDGPRFEAESVATGENDVIILEESLTFPPEHEVTIHDTGIEEEGLLLENTGVTESPLLEVLATDPNSPGQPEGTMLPNPPLEIEASGSGVDIPEDIHFQRDKEAPVSEKEFTIKQVEPEIPEVEDEVVEVPEVKQDTFEFSEVKDEEVEIPGVKEEAVEVPEVKEEAVEVPEVKEEAVEVPEVEENVVEVPEAKKEVVEVLDVMKDVVEVPEIKEEMAEVPVTAEVLQKEAVDVLEVKDEAVEVPKVEEKLIEFPEVEEVVEIPEVEKKAVDGPDVKIEVVEVLEVKEEVVEVPVKTEVEPTGYLEYSIIETETVEELEENVPEAPTEVAGEEVSVSDNSPAIKILPPDEPEDERYAVLAFPELDEDDVGSLEEGPIIEQPVNGEDTLREMEEVVVVKKDVEEEVATDVPYIFEISEKELVDDEVLLVDKASPEAVHPTPVSAEKESSFTLVSDIIVGEEATAPEPEDKEGQVTPALIPAVYQPGPDISITLELQTIDPVTDYDLVQFGGTNQTEDGSSGYPAGVRHGTDHSVAMPINPGRSLMVFFSLRVTNMIFSDDLFNKSSPEYKALEQRFLELLVPYLQSNLSNFQNLEILNFRNGSIVVNSRMKFGKPVPRSVNSVVYLILEDFANTAYQTMNLAIDKYSLDVESGDQANPCKFQACNEFAQCLVNQWSGEAECVCNAGYFSVDGLPCQSICDLQTDFCMNDGKCDIIPGQGAICRCRVGENWWYRGEHCEEYVSEPLVVGIAIASVAGFLLVASAVIFFLARTLRDQYDKDEAEDPIRRGESIPSLERATKYNPMYESEATTGYSHYYRRYPEAPVYSSASAEASTDFSSEEIRHIYENSELTKEEIQDRIRIIELYAKDRQFADFVRQHQTALETCRESVST